MLAPITPGKLRGLEVHANRIEAETHLRHVANLSTVFGGDDARRYIESLKETILAADRAERGEKPLSKEQREAIQQAKIEDFKTLVAMAESRCRPA